MNNKIRKHWNDIYNTREVNTFGWYEEKPTPCLRLLAKSDVWKDEPILDVGAGASTFIDSLVNEKYTNIIAIDIIEIALNKLKERLGKKKASKVKWIIDDITYPEQINKLKDISVWHDRAILHFLIEEDQRQTYYSTLKKVVRKGGYVIIAAFSLRGARKCSGLDVKNYDARARVFYPLESVPSVLRIIFLINPLTYVADIIRFGLFGLGTSFLIFEAVVLMFEVFVIFFALLFVFKRIWIT